MNSYFSLNNNSPSQSQLGNSAIDPRVLNVQSNPLEEKPALFTLIPDIASIVLDYCPSSICANAFYSSQWYTKLANELTERIKPIAATINCKANLDTRHPERYCLSIANQIHGFVERAQIPSSDSLSYPEHIKHPLINAQLKEAEDLDLSSKIDLIQQIIDFDLDILYSSLNYFCLPDFSTETEIAIKANKIRKVLNDLGLGSIIKMKDNIDLTRKGLNTLPYEICCFIGLNEIKLGYNYLQQIPEYIKNFKHLAFLYIDNNQLQELPESIGHIANPIHLNIDRNQIKKLPESLVRFTILDFDQNPIQELPLFYKEVVRKEVQSALSEATSINDTTPYLSFTSPEIISLLDREVNNLILKKVEAEEKIEEEKDKTVAEKEIAQGGFCRLM